MSDKTETALAVVEQRPALMRPVVSPTELIAHQKEMHSLIVQALEEGRDYGKVPGTQQPTLLKPGAERIGLAFGTYPRYSVIEADADHNAEIKWSKTKWKNGRKDTIEGTSLGRYRYVVRCELVQRNTDAVVGDGIGSASTLESKYIDRPRDMENTVLKMAQKRAFIAATLNTYALSDRFTQDMEDIAPVVESPPEPVPTDERARKAVAAFAAIGVLEDDIARKLGKPLPQWTDADIEELTAIYKRVRGDKEAILREFELQRDALEG